jgi:hypothetical protein
MNIVLRAGCVAAASVLVLAGCTSSKSGGGSSTSAGAAPKAAPTSTAPPLTAAACGLLSTAEITAISSAESAGATLSGLVAKGGPIGGRELCSWRFTQKKGKVTSANSGVSLSLTPPTAGLAASKQCSFTASGAIKGSPVPGLGSYAVVDPRGACALLPRNQLEISYFGDQGGAVATVNAAMATVLKSAVAKAGNG